MKFASLRPLASIVLTSFSTSLIAPLAQAAPSQKEHRPSQSAEDGSLLDEALSYYERGLSLYEKKGLKPFLASFPKALLSESDQKYLIGITRGWGPLPKIERRGPNTLIISEAEGEGEPLTLEVHDRPQSLEFSANGHRFEARPSIEENHLALQKALQISKQSPSSFLKVLGEELLPSAQASGSSKAKEKTVITLGVVAATLGIIAIVLGIRGSRRKKHQAPMDTGPQPTLMKNKSPLGSTHTLNPSTSSSTTTPSTPPTTVLKGVTDIDPGDSPQP